MCFTLQSFAMNSLASQSSNSGCDGLAPFAPKSLGVPTNPSPKWYCQRRLTMTLAVRGLAGSTIHLARARRRCWSAERFAGILIALWAAEPREPLVAAIVEEPGADCKFEAPFPLTPALSPGE